MSASAEMLIEKIQSLPPARMAEVDDFRVPTAKRTRTLINECSNTGFCTRLCCGVWVILTMRLTMSFDFGDVILVPFPFTNQAREQTKGGNLFFSHSRLAFLCIDLTYLGQYLKNRRRASILRSPYSRLNAMSRKC